MTKQSGMHQRAIKFRLRFKKVLLITTGWIIAGIYISLLQYVIQEATPPEALGEYDFLRSLLTHLVAGTSGGLVLGAFEIFYFKDRFRTKSFGHALVLKSLFYLLAFVIISGIASVFYHTFRFNVGILHKDVVAGVITYFQAKGFTVSFMSWSVVLIVSLFVLQVSDNFGEGVLTKFILGKYHRPKEEKRIFMFLDLKSSTTIAEKLGHKQYYAFLNEFFQDVSDPVIYSKGEIYQYVGDEITVSWTLSNGIEESNCIQCFFDIQTTVQMKSRTYLEKYRVLPQFKAGLHYGKVTTGEVGVIKKEIVFSGDVLNTTSRIQEACKKHEANLLVSKDLIDLFPADRRYEKKEIGEIALRGRKSRVTLYTVHQMRI